jgi:hypothetical protein
VKPKTTIFGLFRCFEPISKQPKQTELFQIKPKQTETTLNFLKIARYALHQTVSVGLLFVSVQSLFETIDSSQFKPAELYELGLD